MQVEVYDDRALCPDDLVHQAGRNVLVHHKVVLLESVQVLLVVESRLVYFLRLEAEHELGGGGVASQLGGEASALLFLQPLVQRDCLRPRREDDVGRAVRVGEEHSLGTVQLCRQLVHVRLPGFGTKVPQEDIAALKPLPDTVPGVAVLLQCSMGKV